MYRVLVVLSVLSVLATSNYSTQYYDNGNLKSQGWLKDNKKDKYWYFYFPDTKIKSEGHYNDGLKTGYWFIYDDDGKLNKEGFYKDNLKNGWWKLYQGDTVIEVKYKNSNKDGLSIYRVDDKPVKAEHFKNGLKTHVWTSLKQFRKDYSNL